MPSYYNYLSGEDEDISTSKSFYIICISQEQQLYKFVASPQSVDILRFDPETRILSYWPITREQIDKASQEIIFNDDGNIRKSPLTLYQIQTFFGFNPQTTQSNRFVPQTTEVEATLFNVARVPQHFIAARLLNDDRVPQLLTAATLFNEDLVRQHLTAARPNENNTRLLHSRIEMAFNNLLWGAANYWTNCRLYCNLSNVCAVIETLVNDNNTTETMDDEVTRTYPMSR